MVFFAVKANVLKSILQFKHTVNRTIFNNCPFVHAIVSANFLGRNWLSDWLTPWVVVFLATPVASSLRSSHHHQYALSAKTIIIINTVSATFTVFSTWWGIQDIIVIQFRVCQDQVGGDEGDEEEEREECHSATGEEIGLRRSSRQALFIDSFNCVWFMYCYVEIMKVLMYF